MKEPQFDKKPGIFGWLLNWGPGSLAILGLASVGLYACGSVGGSGRLPQDAQTVEILAFEDKSNTPALEQDFRTQLIQAIGVNGRLKVQEQKGDLRLTGEIQQFHIIPLLRDSSQQPIQFKMTIAIDFDLTDLRTDTQLWTTHSQVHLTPVPEGHNEESFDSLNTRTLKVSKTFWGVNLQGQIPEDPAVVRTTLLKEAAEKALRKLLTGF